jgi:hypothetical protein
MAVFCRIYPSKSSLIFNVLNSICYTEHVKQINEVCTGFQEEQYDAPLSRIIALNKPEWLHVLVGCIAAAAVGCTLPLFAILFGEVYGVSSTPLEDFHFESGHMLSRILSILYISGINSSLHDFSVYWEPRLLCVCFSVVNVYIK